MQVEIISRDFNASLGKGNTRSILTKMRDFEQKTEILICCLSLKRKKNNYNESHYRRALSVLLCNIFVTSLIASHNNECSEAAI